MPRTKKVLGMELLLFHELPTYHHIRMFAYFFGLKQPPPPFLMLLQKKKILPYRRDRGRSSRHNPAR